MGHFIDWIFCGLGRFVFETFEALDILEGHFVLCRFVVERYVLGRFVGVPDIKSVQGYVCVTSQNIFNTQSCSCGGIHRRIVQDHQSQIIKDHSYVLISS